MLARMPPSPSATFSTSRGMGSEVITRSAPLVTSAIDLPAVAPRSVQALTAAGLRSNTVTWWLLRLTILRHMGPPMLPTPMNPTFTLSSPKKPSGHLQDQLPAEMALGADFQRLLRVLKVIGRDMLRLHQIGRAH